MPSLFELAALGVIFAPAITLTNSIVSIETRESIYYSIVVGCFAFLTSYMIIPSVSEYFSRKGLKGKDMGRRGTPDESKEM